MELKNPFMRPQMLFVAIVWRISKYGTAYDFLLQPIWCVSGWLLGGVGGGAECVNCVWERDLAYIVHARI